MKNKVREIMVESGDPGEDTWDLTLSERGS